MTEKYSIYDYKYSTQTPSGLVISIIIRR